ncbi:MAG TPA: ATP-binding protein [Terriglobales bacterium]|nr:ATP-binding protein [Terriglobales bacterium]
MTESTSVTAAKTAAGKIDELYREIFRRSIDGIAIIDAEGRYLDQNPAHEELTGYTDSDLKNQTPAIHLGQEGFAEVAVALQRDGRYRGILESRGKNGAIKKLDLAAFAVADEQGQPLYYVGIKRDITEHQRIAEERDSRLRELESVYALTRALNHAMEPQQFYGAAIDALLAATRADRASVLLFDSDDKMHFKAWRGLSETYRQAVDGHSPWQRSDRNTVSIFVDDVLAEPSLQPLAPVFIAEGIRSVAFIPIASEGQLLGKFMVYYNQVHTFAAEETRMAEALASHIAFVIQRRMAEEALRRSEKLAAAGKLAATVAHEINNPLEGVMNLAFLLRHQIAADPIATRYLDDLDNELKRVALITRRTLAFYRDTEPPGRVNLGLVIDELVQLFGPKLDNASIRIHFSNKGDSFVYGSAGEIRQVFLNLLTNAMEAIGTKGEIDISVASNSDVVTVLVADSGPGIDPAKLVHIFEPFFTTKLNTGTGLGLSLSREIVQRYHGTIVASNRSTGGAQMTVTFPVAALAQSAKKRA